ncbi:malto-oligosyltrehalose synthase [Rubrobacter aplysinae]|uniref:malto-oligosyltrehalose synthase n=1 Tax=Rubrobacter aplysinae TaxID=909625 RepID=UPI00064BA83F|nr:malto-oligosyltrehalose synthase [Rubrobacter aplysinae]
MRSLRIPRATYRVQLNGDFTFSDAAGIVPYLDSLGVSHLYSSPYTRSREGSSHGYDVVDHNELDPEVGGVEGYARLVDALSERGMGQILDFVPNHMGIGPDNHRWLDVLENGPASPYAHFFDIDWYPANRRGLYGRVLLPVLGDHYRSILEGGELVLELDPESGSFSVRYYEHRCPLDPGTYPLLLGDVSEMEGEAGGELASLATAFGNLPPREDTSPEAVEERARDARIHRERLARLYAESHEAARHVRDRVELLNTEKESLHELLEEQAYRLSYWRVSSDEINYRRFFSIDDLAGVRVEDERVFDAIHKLALDLVRRGEIHGLRIDHIDGLYDPEGYLERLQKAAGEALGESGEQPVYLLVEKILAGHERLPEDWTVAGTTGYEFAERLNGLFVDPAGGDGLDRAYRRFLGEDYPDGLSFEEVLYRSKREAMRTELASELNVLSRRLLTISEGVEEASETPGRRYDFTIDALREALAEVVAAFPVYRTYIREGRISEDDRRHVEWAVGAAERRSQAADKSSFGFIRGVLLGEEESPAAPGFVMRLQQYTGPVMAKGMEDTALYVFNRLSSLNEVGGEPERFGVSIGEMHQENSYRAREWPHAMLSTSTHDTKRGEDVRVRIDALSEMPGEWRGMLGRWGRTNRAHRRRTERGVAPSRNDEYLLYQTLLGAWPFENPEGEDLESFRERIEGYMLKAVREAGVRTSWTNADEEYEEALSGFVGALLQPDSAFMSEFLPFAGRVSRVGALNSLSQTLVKLTAPGVPDVYQGNDLWDLSLVDPDNRRPVDYALRARMLEDLRERFAADGPGTARSLAGTGGWRDGSPKLHLTRCALTLRREREELFQDSEYLPLEVTGPMADHVFAYARRLGDEAAITVVPRLYAPLAPESGLLPDPTLWRGTGVEMPSGLPAPVRNVLTDETLRSPEEGRLDLVETFASFPVALLYSGKA